jgi:hypothetical protein
MNITKLRNKKSIYGFFAATKIYNMPFGFRIFGKIPNFFQSLKKNTIIFLQNLVKNADDYLPKNTKQAVCFGRNYFHRLKIGYFGVQWQDKSLKSYSIIQVNRFLEKTNITRLTFCCSKGYGISVGQMKKVLSLILILILYKKERRIR